MTLVTGTRYRPILSLAIVVLLAGLLIRVFVLDTFTVVGNSMAPTLINGDYIFVSKQAYTWHSPDRGDIVVGNFRSMADKKAIKRIAGLPNEWVFIESGKLYVSERRDGSERVFLKMLYDPALAIHLNAENYAYRLDPHEYFVIGDSGATSIDSRTLGPIDSYEIDGKVFGNFRIQTFSFAWF